MSERPTRAGGALLVLLISLIAVTPMAQEGYWWGAHDARHAVYFLFEFDQSIRDGILWPRWSPDFAFGYGYPFFNVYGPLTAYVGEAFALLGSGLVGAVKIAFALSVPLSALAMYGLARRLVGPNGALVAAVAYTFAPYHLADLYLRAAMAESWAFVFFPLVLWGFYECVVAPRPRAVALAALAYGGFFLTHPGLAMQVTLLLLAWILFWWVARWRDERRATLLAPPLASAVAGLLGLVAAGIFVFPWLAESRYVNSDQWFEGYFNFEQHFVALWQLVSPYWGEGISRAGPLDTFPFQLGIVPLLLAGGAWLVAAPARSVAARLRLFATGMLAAYVLLMLEISALVWRSPLGELLLKPMQFPWRFLSLAGLALALLAGVATRGLDRRGALLAALIMVGSVYPYLSVEPIEPAEGPVSHAALMRFQQSAGEMTGQSACAAEIPDWSPLADAWVSGREVTSRFDYAAIPSAGNAVSRSAQEITEVLLEAPATARWYITYYPGWKAYRLPLDADAPMEELEIRPAPVTCHITVEAPAGHYRLLVRFEDTPVRRLGRAASLLGLLLIGGLLWVEPGRLRRPRRLV